MNTVLYAQDQLFGFHLQPALVILNSPPRKDRCNSALLLFEILSLFAGGESLVSLSIEVECIRFGIF